MKTVKTIQEAHYNTQSNQLIIEVVVWQRTRVPPRTDDFVLETFPKEASALS